MLVVVVWKPPFPGGFKFILPSSFTGGFLKQVHLSSLWLLVVAPVRGVGGGAGTGLEELPGEMVGSGVGRKRRVCVPRPNGAGHVPPKLALNIDLRETRCRN